MAVPRDAPWIFERLGRTGNMLRIRPKLQEIGTCGGTVMTVPYIMGGKMVVALQEKI